MSRRARAILALLAAAIGCPVALAGGASAPARLTAASPTAGEKHRQVSTEVKRTNSSNGDLEYVHYRIDGVRSTLAPMHFGVTRAALAVSHDAQAAARDPRNPLALNPAPRSNPLQGARLYADRWGSPAAKAQPILQSSNPAWASAISVIANEPWADRFGAWNGADPSQPVFDYLQTANLTDPGAVPLLATYRLVAKQCTHGGFPDSPSFVADYKRFIDGLSYGIGNFRAVLFLEMDSLITSPCLNSRALNVRLSELRYAITTLERNPHLVVYVDGGAADALRWQDTARLLNQAGVHQAQGFFLNSTHFDWTTSEIAYGQQIAKALGGVHFVVNTGENGQGPLVPRDVAHQGNEVLCNPPGRGLGPKATTNTGYAWVDAFAWTSNPGESGGPCVPGAPGTGVYWPEYAVGLVRRANFNVTGPGGSRLLRGVGNVSAHSSAKPRGAHRRGRRRHSHTAHRRTRHHHSHGARHRAHRSQRR